MPAERAEKLETRLNFEPKLKVIGGAVSMTNFSLSLQIDENDPRRQSIKVLRAPNKCWARLTRNCCKKLLFWAPKGASWRIEKSVRLASGLNFGNDDWCLRRCRRRCRRCCCRFYCIDKHLILPKFKWPWKLQASWQLDTSAHSNTNTTA